MEFKPEELALLSWINEGLPNDKFLQIPEEKLPKNTVLLSIIRVILQCQEFSKDLQAATQEKNVLEGRTLKCGLEDLLQQSLLKTLSRYPSLLTERKEVLILLEKFKGESSEIQKDEYHAFLTVYSVIMIILESSLMKKSESDVFTALKSVQNLVFAITSEDKRLAVLEDTFSLLFFMSNQIEQVSKIQGKNGIWIEAKERNLGFICKTPGLIKAVLNLVEDCMEAFEWSKENINPEIRRLSQHTSELKWKLEVVKNIPICEGSPKREHWLSQLYSAKSDDSDDEITALVEKKNRKNDSTESSDTSRSCTSPEVIVKQGRRHPRRRLVANKRDESSIVNKLLCSPTELITLCLLAGSQSQACEIVKMWNLWDTVEGQEVVFSKGFEDLRHKLMSFDKSAVLRAVNSPVKFSPKGNSPGLLKGLRLAASSSLGSSAIPNLVEDLVSNGPSSVVLNVFDDINHVRQFVAVDLAVSGSLHFPSVHTLLNMVDTESTEVKVNPVYLKQWFNYVQELKYLASKFLESRDPLDFQTPFGLPSSSSLLTRTYPKDPKSVINDFQLRVKILNILSDLEKESNLKGQLDTLDKLAKLFPDGTVRGLAVFLRTLYDTLLPYAIDWKTLNDMIDQSPQTIIYSIFLKLNEEKIQKFENDLSSIGISLPHSLSNSAAPGLKLKECAAFCNCTKNTCDIDKKIINYLSSENVICVYFVRLSNGMVDDVPDYLVSYAKSKRRQRLMGRPGGLVVCLRAALERFQRLIDEGKVEAAISLAASTQPPFLEFPEIIAFLQSQKQKLDKNEKGEEQNIELIRAVGASDMLSSLPPQFQNQLQHCHDPILIYEIFLMNGLFQQISDTIVTVKANISIPFLKEKLDNLFLGYAEKALLIEEETIGAKSQTAFSKASSESYFILGSSGSFQSPSKQETESFQMPVTTPTKEEWIPDSKVRDCMCCGMVAFSLFNRRHHCRRCGRVVCSSCSKHRAEVSGYGVVPVKVCNDCFQSMEEMRGHQQTTRLSTSFEHETNPQQGPESLLSWILTGDHQHDTIVRSEFAYESAPDSQLCLNILGFVSNFLTSSMFLLSMSEKLLDSLSLKAVSDRSFLLQIIKSLILAAKVQISSESTRVYSAEGQVPDNVLKQLNIVIKSHDEISSRMEVVLLLEAAGCFHLINRKHPNFRQLRQKLIDEERWQLALEVSTKCGLDAATVWASWGIVCLKAGNLNGARSRLSKCLEPRRVSPILDEVVNVLEALSKTQRAFSTKRNNNSDDNNPYYLQSRLDRLNAISEGSFTHLTDLKEVKHSSRDRCLNEAEFYLKTYGSPESLLSFYVRHSMFSAGIQYTKKNKAPVDTFINGFWIPACQFGCMEDLLKIIKQTDPLLEFWKDYICEVCKELRKKCYLHTAKRLYCWIGDWVQAGHTCCAIYRMYSSDFKRLFQGKRLLQEAELHFKQFLESKIAMGFTLIDDEVQAVEHASKVSKLQIEASEYIAECQEQLWKTSGSKSVLTYLSQEKKSSAQLSKRRSTLKLSEQNQRIPTLFDDETGVKNVIELLIITPTVDPSRLQLAWKISAEMEVPWKPILENCVLTLSADRRFSELTVFVNFIRYQQRVSGDSSSKMDEALVKAVKLNAGEPVIKDSELIIGLIDSLSAKIGTYLSLGWLQSAYALAVRSQSVPDVRRVLEECEKRNETGIQRLCSNWLALYGNR